MDQLPHPSPMRPDRRRLEPRLCDGAGVGGAHGGIAGRDTRIVVLAPIGWRRAGRVVPPSARAGARQEATCCEGCREWLLVPEHFKPAYAKPISSLILF